MLTATITNQLKILSFCSSIRSLKDFSCLSFLFIFSILFIYPVIRSVSATEAAMLTTTDNAHSCRRRKLCTFSALTARSIALLRFSLI